MRKADVVVYDRLVGPEILERVPARAERIFVGKMRDRHVLPQAEINALLVALARAGKRVLRLKGGDPFIFGRGGEELEALAAAGVPCQVVPGSRPRSAARPPPAFRSPTATMPTRLVFVTGHTTDGEVELDWPTLTRPGQTVVVYMGIKALASLCRRLIDHGLAPTMPAAVVENGTYPHQQVVSGTLETLPALAAERRLSGPSLIIVGEVVRLHEPRPATAARAPGRRRRRRAEWQPAPPFPRRRACRYHVRTEYDRGRQGMRLVQFVRAEGERRVGRVAEDGGIVEALSGIASVYQLALRAARGPRSLTELAAGAACDDAGRARPAARREPPARPARSSGPRALPRHRHRPHPPRQRQGARFDASGDAEGRGRAHQLDEDVQARPGRRQA